jgi:hypothetical protein
MNSRLLISLALGLALAGVASAQQSVKPAKGQSAQQQKSDEAACHAKAVEQTGFDPAKPQAASTPPTTATGTTPGAGARGAAKGALIGWVVGDAGAGAAAGAVVARSQSRKGNEAQQSQQQAQSPTPQQQAAFAKARGACLEGRGYTVK